MAFSKLKALLRKAAERSTEALWTRIGQLVDNFTADECANYFKAAGYGAAWADSAPERVAEKWVPVFRSETRSSF